MPSALPGSYKPVPFWAAVVDKALSERGFWFEKRQYRAHVTLARRVITAGRCGATDPLKRLFLPFLSCCQSVPESRWSIQMSIL